MEKCRLWRGEQEAQQGQVLRILLGLETETAEQSGLKFSGVLHRGQVFTVNEPDVDYWESVTSVEKSHPDFWHALPVITVDRALGEFSYEPLNDFQRAVYALWRESWRARTCPECGRAFIAAKPPQLYCSPTCSTAARRKRDLALWRATGDARRRKRRGRLVRKKGGK